MPPRRRCKVAVRTQRKSCSVDIRKRESRTTYFLVEAMEEGKNLERNLDELHGVWGAECQHSGYRNKRDLRWSVAHNYREPSYKPQGEMRGDAVGEVGGGHISVEGRDNTTRPEERASTFVVLSGEVSDGQLHQIALPAPPRYLWLQTPFLESTKARA